MKSLSLANLHAGLLITAVICIIILVYRLYQTFTDFKSVKTRNANRTTALESLKTANHKILNDGKGKEGEDSVYAAVRRICKELDIEAVTNRELHRPHAILRPKGDDAFSKEIDLILVSEIGIFVFEVKNWQGTWSPQTDDHCNLQCTWPNGDIQARPAPLAKTQGKLKQLLQLSGLGDVPAESIVVFTHQQASLDPHLPPNYLHISELQYFFRTKQAEMQQRQERWDVQSLFESMWSCLDASPNAMHNHMMRLSPTSDSLKKYQANHRNIVAIEKQPVLTFKMHRPLKFWLMNAAVYITLALFVGRWV